MAGRLVRAFGALLEEPLRNGLNRPKIVRGQGVKMVNMGELFAHDRIGDVAMEYVPLSDTEAERFLLRSGDL
jgi:type I restriction enzyme S subunit